MHVFKSHVLPVMAGAAIVVGGLNVASYAVGGHHAAATHGSSVHWTAPDRSTPADAKVRHGAYVFKVPHHTTVPFFFQLKAVPKGRYAASLNVGTTSATGPFVPFCSVADSTSRLRRTYGSQTRCRSAFGMPGPSSSTQIRAVSPATSEPTVMV